MKACFLAMLALLVASYSAAQSPYTEKQVIAYAKSIDVKTLDASLPSHRLEDWLQSGTPHTQTLSWSVEDTCWNKPFKNEDYPLCAHVRIIRNGQSGEFLIEIGTLHKGIVGPPKLSEFGITIWEEPLWRVTGGTERLSDLPGLLDQPNRLIVDGVRKLYEEIVAHHPIGIPVGAEKVTIWPFLSKRLTEQLQTAQACEEDYFRQHPTADSTAKPAWLKSGIFSGDSNRALPTNAFAYSAGPQKDGSFPVNVDLTYTPDPMRALDRFWGTEARVVAEDGRFVVDNVRIFDSDSTDPHRAADAPSHLLSDSFAGCDGPHWTGQAVTNTLAAPLTH
jgi:hypothetical protein